MCIPEWYDDIDIISIGVKSNSLHWPSVEKYNSSPNMRIAPRFKVHR